ncbi:molybdopterin cofactor-binding domain-containing protein, partial [Vibrio parahaemolyticus]
DELPAVTTPAQALAPDAPQIHDDAPGNLVLDFFYGNAETVKKAFAEAAHVTRLDISSNRVVVSPMEPRSAIGSYENDRWVLRLGC